MRGGSSQPWLARASDDRQYVVKFAGAGAGPEALAAELVVSRMARTWRMPVPRTLPIELTSEVPRAGTDEHWDVLDASRGLNLAIEVVADAATVDVRTEAIAADVLAPLVVLDSLFANADRTNLSSNLVRDAHGKLWLIDHGSCRFLHRPGVPTSFSLYSNHFLAGTSWIDWIAEAPARLSEVQISNALSDLPDHWMTSVPIQPADLVGHLVGLVAGFARWVDGQSQRG